MRYPSRPKTKKDWELFDEKNRALAKMIADSSEHYYDVSDQQFSENIKRFSRAESVDFMKQMKNDLEFYKKVLNEKYYLNHPEKKSTHRYTETLRIAKSINSKGKIMVSHINTFETQ